MWEKEKLLIKSNFSFSHNVFKSCLLLMHQNEYLLCKGLTAEPDSAVSSVAALRTRVHWSDLWLGQYFTRGLMIVIAIGFIPLSQLSVFFDNDYMRKQPVAWKEYLCGVLVSMGRCTGHRSITEILLKMALNTAQSINPSLTPSYIYSLTLYQTTESWTSPN